MRLLDRLIYRELLGPWIFGVAMFTVVLMAGTYLFRLTNYLVEGVPVTTILHLTMLYMPGLLAKTFAMSSLLASLLAFARLSNDSEVIAMHAAGISLLRAMAPVAFFGFLVSALTFVFGEFVVPRASYEAVVIQAEVLKKMRDSGRPYYQPLYVNGELRGILAARDVDLRTGTMKDVLGAWYGPDGKAVRYFFFNELYYTEDEKWMINGGESWTRLPDGNLVRTVLGRVEPPKEMILSFTPKELTASSLRDTDSFSMAELKQQIEALKQNPRMDPKQIRDLEVGFWSKISIPLSALVFCLVGAPVAIRRVRQSVGVGVATSIVIIFLYYMLFNYLNILAKGGRMDPAVSAFLPVAAGLVAAAALIWSKSR